VGVYANFGNVEVITMDEVFNYIHWNNTTSTWSIEVVPVNMSLMQIPKVVDGVWDLNVSKNLEIEVKPYAARKLADPGYPYFFSADANPAYHNRLNLDGDLYLSKLFAWGINMPAGTPLKWLTLDANRNIVFSDAPAGGATPNDDILKWDVNKYAPYTARQDDNEWIEPYFYKPSGIGLDYPIHTLPVYLDGSLTAFSLEASKDLTSGNYVTYFVNSENGIGINLYNGVYKTFSIKHDSSGSLVLSANSASASDKIYIGSKTAVGAYHGEHVVVDDLNYRFDINMTKVRLNKGTASRFLAVDANKEVVYTDSPALEVRIFNTENLPATSRFIILEPKAKYAYTIVSFCSISQDSAGTIHIEKNSTVYGNFGITSSAVEILGGTSELPASLAVNDMLKLNLPGGEGRCTFRLILKRTTI